MPQLVIIADRVNLGMPGDVKEGPVMGGFQYAEPGDGIDFMVNVHDVHVDRELGSYANVSVAYVIPDVVGGDALVIEDVPDDLDDTADDNVIEVDFGKEEDEPTE